MSHIWPDYPYDALQEYAVLQNGELRALLYWIGLEKDTIAAGQEVVANLTSLFQIPWKNVHCLNVKSLFNSSINKEEKVHVTDRIYKRVVKFTTPHPGHPPSGKETHIIVLSGLEGLPTSQIRELDWVYRLNDPSIRKSILPSVVFLFTSLPFPAPIQPPNPPASLSPPLSSNPTNPSVSSSPLSEYAEYLVGRLHSAELQFNGEAFLGRFQRVAHLSPPALSSCHSPFSPPSPTSPALLYPPTPPTVCAYVSAQRRLSRSLVASSAQGEMSFSSFLALYSLPIIFYYLYKRFKREREREAGRRERKERAEKEREEKEREEEEDDKGVGEEGERKDEKREGDESVENIKEKGERGRKCVVQERAKLKEGEKEEVWGRVSTPLRQQRGERGRREEYKEEAEGKREAMERKERGSGGKGNGRGEGKGKGKGRGESEEPLPSSPAPSLSHSTPKKRETKEKGGAVEQSPHSYYTRSKGEREGGSEEEEKGEGGSVRRGRKK